MKAVVLDVPQAELDERRRRGLDVFDEVWEGVLHMVPPPSGDHQGIGSELIAAWLGAARSRGLIARYGTGLFAAADDYRVPDLVIFEPANRSDRGVDDTARLVVEIRSPHDETDAKVPWYAARDVDEIVVIDPVTRTVELYVSRAGQPVLVQHDGRVILRTLDADLSTVDTADGPRLRLQVDDIDVLA